MSACSSSPSSEQSPQRSSQPRRVFCTRAVRCDAARENEVLGQAIGELTQVEDLARCPESESRLRRAATSAPTVPRFPRPWHRGTLPCPYPRASTLHARPRRRPVFPTRRSARLRRSGARRSQLRRDAAKRESPRAAASAAATVPAAKRAGAAAADQAQGERQPRHCRSRAGSDSAPPRKKSRRGKLRRVFRRRERLHLLGGEMAGVAPGGTAPRRCRIDDGRANAVPLQVQRAAQTDESAADHQRVGRHRYCGGCRLRWLIRSSRTPLM